MKISGYTIDFESAVNKIKNEGYKRVVLQLPEGLKTHFVDFADFIQSKTDAEVIASADPCFGACDIISNKLENLDIDFILQIGHTQIPELKNYSIPTTFLNAQYSVDLEALEKKIIPYLKEKVGLVTTAQHVDEISKISKKLFENQIETKIGKGDSRIAYKGQILGCNFSSAKKIADVVDMFLFIGSGNFHPLGLMISTKKKVVAYDPYTNEVKSSELDDLKDITLKQRYGAIARAKDAKVFGILIGTKIGQQRIRLAEELKEIISSKNKKAYTIVVDHFAPEFLESFRNIDCFVSTACPRIAIDDYMQYKIPILTPVELKILLGFIKWDDYVFDEITSN